MGITMGDLKEGLSQGKISVEEFQNQLIEMDTKGGGGLKSLSQIAKDSTKELKPLYKMQKQLLHVVLVR